MAWIRLNSGIIVSDIRDYYLEQILYHKIPKYVEFVNEYPMTTSGKIQKYRLQEMGAEFLEK